MTTTTMMRRAALLFIALSGGVLSVIACGGDDEAPPADVDAGQDSGLPDTNKPDTAVADTGTTITDTGTADTIDAFVGGKTLDGGACGGDPVALTSVVPQFAWKDAPTPLTLTGTGFIATPKVYLRAADGTITQIQHVAFVSSTSITAVVPSGTLLAGTYEVAIVNGNSCAGTLVGALRIVDAPPPTILDVSPATGTTQTDVPVVITGCHLKPDAQLSVVTSAGAVTVMTNAAPVCGAAPDVRCDGTPLCTMSGTIQTKTKTLTSGAYLVRVTNVAEATFGEFATFVVTNPAGNLGTWVTSPSLVTGRRSLGVVAGRVNTATRFIYAIGGENGGGIALDTIEVGPLDRFGQLGAWFVQSNKLNKKRSGPAVARYGSWIYVIGGTESTNGTGGQAPTGTALTSFERAKILDPAGAPIVKDPPTTSTTSGALAKGTWYYRVSAVGADPEDPGGESLASDEVVATLDANGTVTLSWQAVTGATEYRVYRSAAPDAVSDSETYLATVQVTTDAGASTSLVDDGTLKADAGAIPTTGFLRAGSTGKWLLVADAIGGGGVGKLNAAATIAKNPTTDDQYVYVTGGWGRCLGGAAAAVLLSCVEYAKINTDGSLGAFTAGGALVKPRMRHGVQVMTKENGAGFEDAGATNAAFIIVGGGNGAQDATFTNIEYSLVSNTGANGGFSPLIGNASFSAERDGDQLLVANGFAYAFFGGAKQGVGINYSGTADQSTQAIVTPTTLTFASWNNAGANLGGGKLGRHGMTTESAYFYLVGGTSNDTDALNTVLRILH